MCKVLEHHNIYIIYVYMYYIIYILYIIIYMYICVFLFWASSSVTHAGFAIVTHFEATISVAGDALVRLNGPLVIPLWCVRTAS